MTRPGEQNQNVFGDVANGGVLAQDSSPTLEELINDRLLMAFKDGCHALMRESFLEEGEGGLQTLAVWTGEWVDKHLEDQDELVVAALSVLLEELFDHNLRTVQDTALKLSVLQFLAVFINLDQLGRSADNLILLNEKFLEHGVCLL